MLRARAAARWWREIGFAGRRQRLRAWRRSLSLGWTELADLVHRENGKPLDDAIGEIAVAVAHLAWATRHAEPVLRRRAVRPGLLGDRTTRRRWSTCPYGVVGVIGPWNFPVHTPMGSISYALAAGNAVVFKPSEYTPAIARWLVDAFDRAVPEHPVLQLVTGLGATGEALCRAGVDKIAFTGSAATGRLVMASCAPTLTPVMMECGGKDALIVAEDADVSAAADAAVWASMANAGQSCVGVERAYVVPSVYDEFVRQVVEQARELRPGIETDASYGPITMPVAAGRHRRSTSLPRRPTADSAVLGGPDIVRAAVRGAVRPRRRSRGLDRDHRRDVRSHAHDHPGPRRRRRGGAGQREPVAARRRRLQRAAGHRDRGAAGHRHGHRQFGASPSR